MIKKYVAGKHRKIMHTIFNVKATMLNFFHLIFATHKKVLVDDMETSDNNVFQINLMRFASALYFVESR